MAKAISPDAEAVLAGADQATRDYVLQNAPGDKLTSGEAATLLNSFKVSGNPYSAGNISAASTDPLAGLDYSDPLGIQKRIYDAEGVNAASNDYINALGQLRKFKNDTLAQYNAIEDKTIKGSVITGMQANQGRLRGQQQEGLSANVDTLRDFAVAKQTAADKKVAIAMQQRDELTNLIVNNPGAGVTYADTVTSAAAKINKYNEKVAKNAEKKALKDMAMQAGLKTSGSSKTLRKRIAKAAKKDKELALQMSQLDLQLKQAQIKNVYSEISNRGSATTEDIQTANENAVFSAFQALPKGEDRFTNPNDWQPLLNSWINAGGKATDFFDKFGKFVNPNDV